MASTLDFVTYVCEQLRGSGELRYRKMFGEYMVYVDDKPILLICDDTVYVKQLAILAGLMDEVDKGFPYPGAKEHYILDIDNVELSKAVVATLLPLTSVPKPRKKQSRG